MVVYNTHVHIYVILVFFFSSHHPKSIYTFLKPDKVQSIFPLGRMDENCFICGKIISCCQKVFSSHIKHKIFHDFYIKQSNRIEFPIFTKSRFTSRVFIFTSIAHRNFNFCLYHLFIKQKGDKYYRKLTGMVCNRHIIIIM